ncbi:MAG: hypothetical protein RLY23_1767, partial [Actinomycetota bacterium]
MTRALGVDLGEKRIGIALSDPTRTIASPHSVIKRSGNAEVDRRAVLNIAREEGVTQLVVGLPLTLTGARRAAARAALAEIEALKELAPDLIVEAFDDSSTESVAISIENWIEFRDIGFETRDNLPCVVFAAVINHYNFVNISPGFFYYNRNFGFFVIGRNHCPDFFIPFREHF